jgi:hypothetical protein
MQWKEFISSQGRKKMINEIKKSIVCFVFWLCMCLLGGYAISQAIAPDLPQVWWSQSQQRCTRVYIKGKLYGPEFYDQFVREKRRFEIVFVK